MVENIKLILNTGTYGYLKYNLCQYFFIKMFKNLEYLYNIYYFVMISLF